MPESTSKTRMEYEVFEDKLFPGDWRVEATDYEDDGEFLKELFEEKESLE